MPTGFVQSPRAFVFCFRRTLTEIQNNLFPSLPVGFDQKTPQTGRNKAVS